MDYSVVDRGLHVPFVDDVATDSHADEVDDVQVAARNEDQTDHLNGLVQVSHESALLVPGGPGHALVGKPLGDEEVRVEYEEHKEQQATQ